MKRHEVLDALYDIYEMSDHDLSINHEYIRKVSVAAYSLIKQKYNVKHEPKPKAEKGAEG